MSFRSAAECAAGYLGIYALAGMFLVPIVEKIEGPSVFGGMPGLVILIHFISAVALWPSGVLTVLFLQKRVGPAPWRRLWLAGILAVPVVWLGALLASAAFGPEMRHVVSTGAAVLLSTLILLVTWLLPRRPVAVQR